MHCQGVSYGFTVFAIIRYMYHTRFLSLITVSHYLTSAIHLTGTDVLYSAVPGIVRHPCSSCSYQLSYG